MLVYLCHQSVLKSFQLFVFSGFGVFSCSIRDTNFEQSAPFQTWSQNLNNILFLFFLTRALSYATLYITTLRHQVPESLWSEAFWVSSRAGRLVEDSWSLPKTTSALSCWGRIFSLKVISHIFSGPSGDFNHVLRLSPTFSLFLWSFLTSDNDLDKLIMFSMLFALNFLNLRNSFFFIDTCGFICNHQLHQ